MIIAFLDEVDTAGNEARQLLLEDEGQVNLAWDALKPLFPTCRFRTGDELTAIELGRLYGHWRSLWIVITVSESIMAKMSETHQMAVEIRNKIDTFCAKHFPDASTGVDAGIFHLLSSTNDPTLIEAIRAKDVQFQSLAFNIREMSYRQPANEREGFMKGFDQAFACVAIDCNGAVCSPDKLAQLLVFCRPFAVRAGLAASDFQEALEFIGGQQTTGTAESFTKRLQRRKASLRRKGRPRAKPATHAKRRSKK